VVHDWLGKPGLLVDQPVAVSQEASFLLEKGPGCDVFIGIGGCMVHTPGDDCNDACLSTGASCCLRLAAAYLRS
jgi:hippurate hydrolase